MPRMLRYEYPGAIYHAISRGNNGQEIFISDDGRRLFLSTLKEVCEQTGWVLHAYVLMSNHYHLLLETPEANLVAGMKWFQGTYTQRFNAMFQRQGHLFQGRYKALPVDAQGDPGWFAGVSRYIHLNPFRAGVAGVGLSGPLEEYPWSSYPAYAGIDLKPPVWLRRERVLAGYGLDQTAAGLRSYRQLVSGWMKRETTDESDLFAKVETQLKRGWFVGGEMFKKGLTNRTCSRTDNLRADQRRAHNEAEAERLLRHALILLGLTEEELSVMKTTSAEKQAVAWLLKKKTTVTAVWLTGRLKMGHRTNVSRAISAFNRTSEKKRVRIKKKMLQCTG